MKKNLFRCLLAVCSVVSALSAYAQGSKNQSTYSGDGSTLSLRSNVLYFAGGLFNVGAEWRAFSDSKLSYLLNAGYSPFGHTDWERNMGGWFVSPEVRYHFNGEYGWFAGVQLLYGGANIKFDTTGYQGSAFMGGALGGYKLELSPTFDMDFTLGLGYGSFNYDTYVRDTFEQGVNLRTGANLQKSMLVPMQAGVSLIWKIR